MISGKSAIETAKGKKNAFYNTLEELHSYFDRIDIISPVQSVLFENVFFHTDIDYTSVDVMTVHEYAPFRNGRLANQLWEKYGIPMIFEIMHIPGVPHAGTWKEWLAGWMTKWYIKRDVRNAKAVRVINTHVAVLLQEWGVPKEKVKLVPAFYIDMNIFKPLPVQKKYDIVYVGRRASNKGIELFEAAAKQLQASNKHIKALVVDGWAKDSQEIAHILNESRILIMPSYNEGGPRVVLEALACGTPVLATRVGIVPEVLPEEYIIDWTVDDIVTKVQKMLTRKVDQEALVRRVWEYEKTAAIKKYAEAIISCAKS